jgi:NAD(P)-dependent dehydrogenase (short-subunit alcohol dehydrogenase family)
MPVRTRQTLPARSAEKDARERSGMRAQRLTNMWDAGARRLGRPGSGLRFDYQGEDPQMPAERAAIVTGASSGIGLAIARVLGEEQFGVTMAARRPEKLDAAVAALAADGLDVHGIAANVSDETEIKKVVAEHSARYGRLDVLVNNAGVGVGQAVAEIETRRLDMQLDINLRSIVLFYRECVPLLKQAAGEHKNALVVNTSSISGKRGEAWLSVYSATKHGVVGWTEAMNKELGGEGIKSTALCPAFVDTPMTDFVKGQVAAEDMIRPEDIAEAVRYLLKVSPACVVPEMMFVRPDDSL